MFLLKYGEECVPKSMSVKGASGVVNWEPVVGILVETEIGWVVLDTGFSRRYLDDHDACYAVYGPAAFGADEFHPPRALEGEPFRAALAGVGVEVSDIALAAVSHFHVDHSGGIPDLAEQGVPIVVQRRELEFAMERSTIAHAYYRPDFTEPPPLWRIVDGDAEIAPGIEALLSPGHTPGHMSYRVDLPETGTWIFTMDAADLAENLFDRSPIGTCAEPADEAHVLPSLIRLLDLAAEVDARIIPCHDPHVWRAVRHPPGGHR